MEEVEKQVLDPVEETPQAETPETATESSPTPESGNEESPNETQEESVDWKKRYSDSSREAARLREEAEKNKRLADDYQQKLLSRITRSREDYEEFINEQGLSPQEKQYYMNIYDSQIAPAKSTETRAVTETEAGTPSPSIPQEQPQQVDPFREAWMNRMDEEERERFETQRKATTEFFTREENVKLPPTVQESIRITAAMLDQEFGYSPNEALEVARKRILDPEAIKEEGYTEGVKDSLTGGITRGVSGGSAKSEETVKLPAKDEAFVQLEIQRKGLKGDAVNEFRRKYAERLAQNR